MKDEEGQDIRCPKCRSKYNIIKLRVGYRCIYCMTEFLTGKHKAQTTLS